MSDNSSREEFDRDEELRAMLRAADPARSLAPVDPAALARLLEDTMSSDLDARPDADFDTAVRADAPARRRSRLTWLVGAAAAAVVVTAGVGAVARLGGGDDKTPVASSHHGSTGPAPTESPRVGVTRLTAALPAGRCAQPTAELIGSTDTAFRGTVTAIRGNVVTIQTTSVYHGQVGRSVQITAPAGLGPLVESVHFAVGGSYLVSAADGQVALCGFSGKAGGRLAGLYLQAFPR